MSLTAVINIAKGQLGMAEDDYRAMLDRVTGKRSLRAMSDAEQRAVVSELERLGFRNARKMRSSSNPYVRKIYALWGSCARLGVVDDGSKGALRSFCTHLIHGRASDIGVDPDLLSYDQASPIIEALKKMEARGKNARARQ